MGTAQRIDDIDRAVSLGLFTGILDAVVVNVVLPTLPRHFRADTRSPSGSRTVKRLNLDVRRTVARITHQS